MTTGNEMAEILKRPTLSARKSSSLSLDEGLLLDSFQSFGQFLLAFINNMTYQLR